MTGKSYWSVLPGVSCYTVRTRSKEVGRLVFHTGPSVQGCPANTLIKAWGIFTGPSLSVCVLLLHQDKTVDTWEILAGRSLPVCVLLRHEDRIKMMYGGMEVPAGPSNSALGVRSVEKRFEDWTIHTGSVRPPSRPQES